MMSLNSKRRRGSSSRKASAPWWRQPANWVVIAILGTTVAVVSGIIRQQTPEKGDIDRSAIAAAELTDSRMKEIQQRFRCPCGNCAHLELEECECDVPGGAMEMKTAIARLLVEGKGESDVVAEIATRFGGLKPAVSEDRQLPAEEGLAGKEEPVPGLDLQASHGDAEKPGEMIRVISQFDCPCNQCVLTLLECTCDHPRGAVEVKAYIAQRLSEGMSESQVIDSVVTTYAARRRPNTSAAIGDRLFH